MPIGHLDVNWNGYCGDAPTEEQTDDMTFSVNGEERFRIAASGHWSSQTKLADLAASIPTDSITNGSISFFVEQSPTPLYVNSNYCQSLEIYIDGELFGVLDPKTRTITHHLSHDDIQTSGIRAALDDPHTAYERAMGALRNDG